MANVLAYYRMVLITTEKSFIVQVPGDLPLYKMAVQTRKNCKFNKTFFVDVFGRSSLLYYSPNDDEICFILN